MRLLPFGPRAVLVELGEDAGPADALAVAALVRGSGIVAEEVVPAARTVLVDGLEEGPEHAAVLSGVLARWAPGEAVPSGDLVRLPVRYDGPDLGWVARAWGVTEDEVVARHTAVGFVSAFCGFAPGFAYLAGLPEELAVPRLESPRASVPAGAVGLAGPWCGVYPTASPGGWRLLGRTEVPLWDPTRPSPALLAPGTRVRFVPV